MYPMHLTHTYCTTARKLEYCTGNKNSQLRSIVFWEIPPDSISRNSYNTSQFPGSMQPVVSALLASTAIVFAFAYPGRNIALKEATECPMASSTAAATAEQTTIFRRPRNISAVPNAGHGRLPCASIFPIHISQQIPMNTLFHSFFFSIHLCMQVGNTLTHPLQFTREILTFWFFLGESIG